MRESPRQRRRRPTVHPVDSLKAPSRPLETSFFSAPLADALKLQCIKAADTADPHLCSRPCTRPAIGYFHPRLAASALVCDSAAEQWLSLADTPEATLEALAAQQVRALVLAANAEHCPRFANIAPLFPGELWCSPLGAAALVQALRRHCLCQLQATTVPGVMLQIHGLGVLLQGASGSGKSGLALELVARGHALVADDAVELRRAGPGCLIASCPETLSNFLAAPDLGIIDVKAIYGSRAIAKQARLDLVISLVTSGFSEARSSTVEERLHGHRSMLHLLATDLPNLSLQIHLGHNPATGVEAACADHWLRLGGYRADKRFLQRQHQQPDPATQATPKVI